MDVRLRGDSRGSLDRFAIGGLTRFPGSGRIGFREGDNNGIFRSGAFGLSPSQLEKVDWEWIIEANEE